MTAIFYNSCWLYTLQLYIAENFSECEKSLAGKKIIHIFQGFYRFRFFFNFLDKRQLPCRLHKAYVTLSSQPFLVGSEISKHNDFDQLWKFKFHFEHFQETHDFLVLTDPLIICVYSRTTDRHFCDQGNVRHPTSKLLKCGLFQTLNTFRNLTLRIFAAGNAPLVWI